MDVTDLKERETSINEANEDYEDEENSLLVPQAFPLTNYRPKKRCNTIFLLYKSLLFNF